MSEIPKAYEPQSVETKWYQFWLDQRCFVADPARVSDKRPAYSIVIPPPNVTGVLHMGHVLNNTIQDILARKARMDGKEVLWLPGTDHAGIATQVIVEKQLKREGIKSRHEIGREEFLKRVWDWKEKHGQIIIDQLKKLGCSCDWTRERFTMDPEYSRCVQKVFVDLYKKGLIYKGKRMVNWCPASLTALSDEEVDMEPQQGFLWHFRVEVADAPGTFLTIATTRPETIPGDTAIAVNPKDSRYAHLVGKHAIRPLPPELPLEKKRIPIIADDHIDPEFGTGVLKVTPAHDKADFEIGQRHQLPVLDTMNPDGTMNEWAGADLRGLDRFEARRVAVEKLKSLDALIKEVPYENKVGFSQRAKVPIEPRLSEQWFLKYPSQEKSRACVASGQMKFHPERWSKVYDYWMANLQDWCISRQLWWGHRVPVWHRKKALPQTRLASDKQLQEGPGNPPASPNSANVWCAVEPPPDPENWEQDPDVLDTWCSSWLWPFATMGWPEEGATLKTFYPTTDLVTGPDIIFFWVARMIMAGYEFMGDLPFRNVYFTGIIRDKQGRKMSKSLGNSPDPLELIARYGADALRFGTMRSAPLGQDVLFDEKDVELGRNFCNKLWNACRFRQMQGGQSEGEIDPVLLTSDDKWILLRLDQAIREINAAFGEYRFNEITQTLYRFFWSEYCDWYVEASKTILRTQSPESPAEPSAQALEAGSPPMAGAGQTADAAARRANKLAVLDFVLSHTLRLFHPFLPFITEELWHGMGFNQELPSDQGGRTIQFAHWPKALEDDFKEHYGLDESDERFVTAKYELITQGRNLRREANLSSSKKVAFVFKPSGPWSSQETEVLRLLLNAEKVGVASDYASPKNALRTLSVLGELFLPLEGLIDVAAERARLAKELQKIEAEIAKVQSRLGNPGFCQKVAPAVLEEHQTRLADWQAKHDHVRKSLEAFKDD